MTSDVRLKQGLITFSRNQKNNLIFSYIIELGVCYLCICEKSYPKKLAFSYLEELQKEFQENYGAEIETVGRPYAFIKFDTQIVKVRRSYQDTRTQRNLQKLNEDLQDVTRIMTKNIQDVLGRGERIDSKRLFFI
jgi:vesicle transport protein SEC22